MARLQDFQNVTPTSSDKILIVQSQGQGLAPHTIKMDSANPTGTGSLSLNRVGSVGAWSVSVGDSNTASGSCAVATGSGNVVDGNYSLAEGRNNTINRAYSHAEGYNNTVDGAWSHAEGDSNEVNGQSSHVEGIQNKANRKSQHVFGEYNAYESGLPNTRGTYVEMVGNGANDANRSNARTLDWSGNEVLAGDLKINGNQSVADGISWGVKVTATQGAINIKVNGNYRVMIMSGMFQQIGALCLIISINAGALEGVKNLYTGAAFSNSHLTFAFDDPTDTLTITPENGSYFNIYAPNISLG